MTEVKICGLTRPVDAEAAVRHGASYLGVILAGGPRLVDAATAAGVVSAAGGRPVFGVFSTQPVEQILRLRDLTGLVGAQLHGPYGVAEARRLTREGMRVWRVARLRGVSERDSAGPVTNPDGSRLEGLDDLEALTEAAEAVLVEPLVPGRDGGAGVALDAALARAARARLAGHRMVLAGGLTPQTVGRAVGLVRPEVVDVSSGVEISPGIKDHAKLLRFLEAAVARHDDA